MVKKLDPQKMTAEQANEALNRMTVKEARLIDEGTGQSTSFEDMGTVVPGGRARLFVANPKPDIERVKRTGGTALKSFRRLRVTDPYADQVRRQRGGD